MVKHQMLKKERTNIMRNDLKGLYQLDVGEWMMCPAAMFAVRGDGYLPPKSPRNDESIYGGYEGSLQHQSQNVINSLEEIIIGSEWEKLDAIANTIALVHFLHKQGLYIYSFNFIPQIDDYMKLCWILQIRIHDKNSKFHKYPRPLTFIQKKKIKKQVLQGLAQKGVKESEIEIIEERE